MIKGAWDAMVGRRVAGVVAGDVPYGRVLYVCFEDGSGFEIFGGLFQGSSELRFKSVRQAIAEFELAEVPYQVHTDPVPSLDPRDVDGPRYIGTPDPAVVKEPPGGWPCDAPFDFNLSEEKAHLLTHRYDEALLLAHAWHRSQKRKGTDVPYVAHLLAVSALVLEHGGTEDEAIAGLLHDGLEDAPNQEEANARRAEIRHRFGEEALAIVEACTDAEPRAKGDEAALDGDARRAQWRVRKTAYVEHFATAPGSVLLVAAADKVHNAGAIVRDVRRDGPETFERFVGRRDGTLWYYGAVLEALKERLEDEARIGGLVEELERLVEGMGEG